MTSSSSAPQKCFPASTKGRIILRYADAGCGNVTETIPVDSVQKIEANERVSSGVTEVVIQYNKGQRRIMNVDRQQHGLLIEIHGLQTEPIQTMGPVEHAYAPSVVAYSVSKLTV